MKIANRIQEMSEPSLLKFYPKVEEEEKKGKKFYFLNIGQPDLNTPPEFMNRVHEIKENVLKYASPEGETELREEVAKYLKQFGLDYEAGDILVTSGGSEALLFVFLTVCNPGEQIITPEPLYSIYKEIAKATNVELVGIPTFAEEKFALPDKEVIEKLITDKTRAILITNPNNPTGKVFSKEEMDRIAELCLQYELYFITDEVYREFVYDDLEYISPGQFPELDENAVIVDSISKRYSACGARIGFVISKNKELIKALRKLCQMRLAVSTVDQRGAVELMKLDTSFFDKEIKEYEKRRDLAYEKLKERDDLIAEKPTGAFYYMVKLPVIEAEDFIKWMIEDFDSDESVLLTPANDFYLDKNKGRDEVRLAYVLGEKDLSRAIDLFLEGLDQYKKLHPENVKEKY